MVLPVVEGVLVYSYFWLGLACFDEQIWAAIVSRRPLVKRPPWYELVTYQVVAVAVLGCFVPSAGYNLRNLCYRDARCRRLTNGGTIDLSDKQWRDYRTAAPLLIMFCVLSSAVSRRRRRKFSFVASLAMLYVAHGFGAIYPLALLLVIRIVPTPWIVAIAALLVKEPTASDAVRRYVFDERRTPWKGLYPWHASIPLLTLRLVSSTKQGASLFEAAEHAFYGPLYATGPVVLFRDFRRHRENQLSFSYAARTALAWVFLELGLRAYPCFAIASSPRLLLRADAATSAAFAIISVNLLFLKFAVIWRVATCLARFDGVDPPVENLNRFVCNNLTISGFWKDWHASFHHWLLHNIYVPLGGRDKPILATTAVFSFAVLWHDAAQPKLLAWGAINLLALLAERFSRVRHVFTEASRPSSPLQLRIRASALAATYLVVLILANIVGYSAGLASLTAAMRHISLVHCLAAFLVLFVNSHLSLRARALL